MGDYNYKLDVIEGPTRFCSCNLIENIKIEITDIPMLKLQVNIWNI